MAAKDLGATEGRVSLPVDQITRDGPEQVVVFSLQQLVSQHNGAMA